MQLGPGLASSWGGCGGKGSRKLAVSAAEAAHGAGTPWPKPPPLACTATGLPLYWMLGLAPCFVPLPGEATGWQCSPVNPWTAL